MNYFLQYKHKHILTLKTMFERWIISWHSVLKESKMRKRWDMNILSWSMVLIWFLEMQVSLIKYHITIHYQLGSASFQAHIEKENSDWKARIVSRKFVNDNVLYQIDKLSYRFIETIHLHEYETTWSHWKRKDNIT